MNSKNHIVIVAGEDSGDFHGANLAVALRQQLPQIRLSGIGGQKMEENEVELIFPSARLAVVGITEVIGCLPDILAGCRAIRKHLRETKPDLLVLIDFPDFNLHLVAPYALKLKIPIVYYISPQVWAWRQGRVKSINKLVEKILVILPFEEEFYRRRGVAVEYVGHPLLDEFKSFHCKPRSERPYIALIPGSRRGEIKRLLPLMLTAVQLYSREKPNTRFLIPVAPSIDIEFIKEMIPTCLTDKITLLRQPLSQALQKVSFALVTSGTATLETALAEVPMVVIYKVNQLSYQLGKRLISVPYISLVNLIAEKEIVPELIQDNALPEKIAAKIRSLFDNPENYHKICCELKTLKKKLGKAGAPQRAADAIIAVLKENG
ncbi:MAG: lipid-A-disaccharide synthase [Deltaproteobacteria bacterium]|nr:lipid-A-disaccharide synthase [Candidatus Tharpella aukensis]